MHAKVRMQLSQAVKTYYVVVTVTVTVAHLQVTQEALYRVRVGQLWRPGALNIKLRVARGPSVLVIKSSQCIFVTRKGVLF